MRRHRKLIGFTVLAITAMIATQQAFAADGDPQPTNPTGFGDLLPTPDLTNGDTRTLFEQYGPMAYSLDVDASWRDPLASVFNGYAQLVMMYIVAIIRGAISVGWWLFSLTDIKPVSDATSTVISATSTSLMGWLLPSALAIGAVAALMQRRSQGSAMSQMLWVGAAGVLSVSFALSSATWVRGVDGARQLGAEAVMSASAASIDNTVQTPIAWPEPAFNGTNRDTLLRKSADATWRGFTVTPWCIAEFGSIEACQRYGKEILDRGTNSDARMDYINGDLKKAEGGSDDAATVRWTKGKNPFGRIGVLTLAAIAATLFAFLTIALAFTALMAFIGCLLLLVVGVFFACLWVIPGRPRQWGMNWFEALLGFVIQSILAMLVFGTTLSLVTAIYGLTGVLGWLPVSGLAIVVLIAAFQLRRVLNGLTTMMRPGTGGLLIGPMTRRAVTDLASRAASRRASPTPAADRRVRRADDGTVPSPTASRRFRTARGFISSGDGPIVRPAREMPARRADHQEATAGPAVAPTVNGRRTTTGDRFLPKPKPIGTTITAASLPAATNGSRKDADRRAKVPVAHERRGRQAFRPAVTGQYRPPKYEAQDHNHSASLRDGPPRAPRVHRRPKPKTNSVAPRPYREYTKVVKDGTTLRVPAGR
jgi:hypothetical protein